MSIKERFKNSIPRPLTIPVFADLALELDAPKAKPTAPTTPTISKFDGLLSRIENPRDFVRGQVSKHKRTLSPKTQQDYLKKARRLETLRQADGSPPDITSISGTSRTFYAYRAAFVWDTVQRAKAAMKARDRAQSIDDKIAARLHLETIKRCAVDLYVYSVGDGMDSLQRKNLSFLGLDDKPGMSDFKLAKSEGRTPKAKPSGKKTDAHKINKILGWRDLIFSRLQSLKSPWLAHAAVCSLTGCRPAELHGMRVIRKDGNLVFFVTGAKTNDGHGQELRTITVGNRPVTLEFLHLFAKAPFTVEVPSTVKDYPNAFTKTLERAGKAVFPAGAPLMGAYVYRHALAADLKADGATSEQIAFVLGHSSTRTQRGYGHARGGLPRNRLIMAVGSQPLKTISTTVVPAQQENPPFYTSAGFDF